MDELRFLPNDPAIVRTLAEWHQGQWGHLTGRDVETRIREFEPQLGSNRIPLTVVAFAEGRPVGTASLLAHDMDTHPELTPWLASVYVAPEQRRQGTGERLCRRIVAEARRLGVPRLYLFTPDQAPWYARMGWHERVRETYRGEVVTIMELAPDEATR